MNLLPVVLAILATVAIASASHFRQWHNARQLEKGAQGHANACRELWIAKEREKFRTIRAAPLPAGNPAQGTEVPSPLHPSLPPTDVPNRLCARLNLFPLVADGKEAHPLLYRLFRQFLVTEYQTLAEGNGPLYRLADELLASLQHAYRTHSAIPPLEKVSLPSMQPLYYRLLRGYGEEIAPLKAHLRVEKEAPATICLCHASQKTLALLFPPGAIAPLFTALHTSTTPLSKEQVQTIVLHSSGRLLDPDLLSLIDPSHPRHPHPSITEITGVDKTTDISIEGKCYTIYQK
jgi:hypothetical protein